MRISPRLLPTVLLIAGLAGCATPPPVAPAASQDAASGHPAEKFDPAPMPFVHYRAASSKVGQLEIPIPPKMPPGTGAVPVSGSPFRGSIVTGFHESF